MSNKAKHCDECKHFKRPISIGAPVCTKGHRPRFYMPKSVMNLSYGFKRKCENFEAKE